MWIPVAYVNRIVRYLMDAQSEECRPDSRYYGGY
jgi:hypothetical protein